MKPILLALTGVIITVILMLLQMFGVYTVNIFILLIPAIIQAVCDIIWFIIYIKFVEGDCKDEYKERNEKNEK